LYVADRRGRALHVLQRVEVVLGAVDRAGLAGLGDDARRGRADESFGDVDAHARRRVQHGLLGGGGVVRGMQHHALAIGQDHAAVGAGERAFHREQVGPGRFDQRPVALQHRLPATGRDRIEEDGARLIAVEAVAAHPRLDDRFAHQARGANALLEEATPRERGPLGGGAGEELARDGV
jgi:hypothetical protein